MWIHFKLEQGNAAVHSVCYFIKLVVVLIVKITIFQTRKPVKGDSSYFSS